MEYYNSENKIPRRGATIALGLYFVVVALLLYKVCFTYDVKARQEEGILVEFGVDEMGDGEEELAMNDNTAAPTPPPASQELEQENLTDERAEEEIDQPEVKEPQEEPKSEPTPPTEVKDTTERRVVNTNALFPGRKEESTSQSSGEKPHTVGNSGGDQGGDEGSPINSESGDSDRPQVRIGNRKPLGVLPQPRAVANNVTGDVVVEVILDDLGNVTSARYRAQGSSTNNSALVNAAIEAAKKSKFNTSDEVIEQGTITYTFKVN